MGLNKILTFVVNCSAIVMQESSFKANPVLGSKRLNTLGLHSARYVVAHAMSWLRWKQMHFFIDKDLRQQYLKEGYIKIDNVLSPEDFEQLTQELKQIDTSAWQCMQGDTATQRVILDAQELLNKPASKKILYSKKMQRIWQFTSTRLHLPLFYLQVIKNGRQDSAKSADQKKDPQKNLHSDTFHPTMKAWLFLQDVEERHGAFTYVPKSQQFSLARLKWERNKVINIDQHKDGYSEKGSLRLDHQGKQEMQLEEAKIITCKANTLVIANTHGFHCRGAADEGLSRVELWGFNRGNPFLPWVGLNIPWLSQLEFKLLRRKLQKAHTNAQQRGGKASWHVISGDEFKSNNALFNDPKS